MNKSDIINKIKEEKIIAIIRLSTKEKTAQCFKALCNGGVKIAEIPFNVQNAAECIKYTVDCLKDTDMIIGAGTVLTCAMAKSAIKAGARFIVTPNVNKKVIRYCQKKNILIIPGVFSPTEAIEAMEYGIDIVKLFPASAYQPRIINDLKTPLNNLEIIPAAGITSKNIKEWLNAGAFACGIGSELSANSENNDFDSVYYAAKNLKSIV